MKTTKRQLRRIIKEEIMRQLNESHPLDADMQEMDHMYGSSDVYSHLSKRLNTLVAQGDPDAEEALMEFDMAEQYGHDDINSLLGILDDFGLKDKIAALGLG